MTVVVQHPAAWRPAFEESAVEARRLVEALLFSIADPLSTAEIAAYLPSGSDVERLLEALRVEYAPRGVNVVSVNGRWCLRTAPDAGRRLIREQVVPPRKLSRAALEIVAIVAWHQPVTRAEIEEIRGIAVSKGTLDLLLEMDFVRMRARRRTPGRPVTYGTTETFLLHFGLETLEDLPGLDELKKAGLLEAGDSETDLPRPGERADVLGPDLYDSIVDARRMEADAEH